MGEYSNKLKQIKYSPKMNIFFQDLLTIDWEKKFPNCLFIRDFENLPNSSPFDIDLLLLRELWPKFENIIYELATKHNLIIKVKKNKRGLIAVIFDPTINQGLRSWAYIEAIDKLIITPKLTILPEKIQIKYLNNNTPVPSDAWYFFLLFTQLLRKNKEIQYFERALEVYKRNSKNIDLTSRLLGISEEEIIEFLDSPDKKSSLLSKSMVIPSPLKKIQRVKGLQKIKNKIIDKFYLINIKDFPLYTIHGADGVGKSTTVKYVDEIFKQYPFEFSSFHHISGWKKERIKLSQKNTKKNKKIVVEAKIGMLRKVIKHIYHLMPNSLKKLWISVTGNILYLRSLNNFLMLKYRSDNIIFVDRYLYDMYVKHKVKKESFPWVDLIFTFIFRKTKYAFVLTDEPKKIKSRKDDLTEDEIEEYQFEMEKILKKLKIKHNNIHINGRSPLDISQEITKHILNDLNVDKSLVYIKSSINNKNHMISELIK